MSEDARWQGRNSDKDALRTEIWKRSKRLG